MGFAVEVFSEGSYALEAAARIALSLPGEGAVVITGGTTAKRIYGPLAGSDAGWGSLEVFFSDERCVPPDDVKSNYHMAHALLLDAVRPQRVHRMKGEEEPELAARAYHEELEPRVGQGLDLALLGLGSDCHVAGMFPGTGALKETSRLCVRVDRPDGLTGLTVTPPVLLSAQRVLVIASGRAKSQAVRRAVAGDEPPEDCPVRLLADHPDATFLADESAASLL
jgi:6-phosphogluconolactonase